MPEDEHVAPKGLFEDTIFEGGLFGKSGGGGHGHAASSWAEHIEHNTKFGYFIFEEPANMDGIMGRCMGADAHLKSDTISHLFFHSSLNCKASIKTHALLLY